MTDDALELHALSERLALQARAALRGSNPDAALSLFRAAASAEEAAMHRLESHCTRTRSALALSAASLFRACQCLEGVVRVVQFARARAPLPGHIDYELQLLLNGL